MVRVLCNACYFITLVVDLSAIDVIFLNVQNICKLIGQEEYNIGRIVHLFSILYFSTNQATRLYFF